MTDLHATIFNLPCEPDTAIHAERLAFKRGHKQARHAAADLVAAHECEGKAITAEQKVVAWQVEFEDGSVELWPAKDIDGEPAFGRWITPLVAGGSPVDLSPDDDSE